MVLRPATALGRVVTRLRTLRIFPIPAELITAIWEQPPLLRTSEQPIPLITVPSP